MRTMAWLLLTVPMIGCGKEAPQEAAIATQQEEGDEADAQFSCATTKRNPSQPLDRMFVSAFGQAPPLGRPAPEGGRESCYRYEPAGKIQLGKVDVLLTEAFTEDCHGCFGSLSIHYLRKANNEFERIGSWEDFVSGEGWGRPPRWTLRRDLTRYPALEIRTQFSNNGYGCEWISLIELTPGEPITRIPQTAAGYDTTGAVGDDTGQAITSTFVPNINGSIDLVFSGTSSGRITYASGKKDHVSSGKNPADKCDI